MKKFLILTLSMLILLSSASLYSCNEEQESAEGLKIVATLFPQYDFVKNIVGDKAQVELLLPPGADSHSFDPSMQDILKMSDADIFIYTGAEMELWAEPFAKNVGDNCIVLDVSEGIELCGISGHEHDHLNVDPHIWTSPVNAMKMVESICDAVCEKDKENEKFYRKNADEYLAKLTALDEEIRAVAETANKKLYFGGEFSFLYFVNEYGFSYMSLYDSCSSHSEPSAKRVTEIISEMKKENAKVIFYPELSAGKAANSISEETGAKKKQLHSCHNLTNIELASGEGYISLMNKNLESIKEALS